MLIVWTIISLKDFYTHTHIPCCPTFSPSLSKFFALKHGYKCWNFVILFGIDNFEDCSPRRRRHAVVAFFTFRRVFNYRESSRFPLVYSFLSFFFFIKYKFYHIGVFHFRLIFFCFPLFIHTAIELYDLYLQGDSLRNLQFWY